MILIVGSTKGGTGKSTLAVNLAIARSKIHPVLLVDGDEQQSSTSFTRLRARDDYTAVALAGTMIRSQVPKLAVHYQDVIIDVGGRDTGSFRAALTIADTLLVPVQPRTFDVWAMETVAKLVDEATAFNSMLNSFTVLNLADVQGRENHDAAGILAGYPGITYLDCPIRRRKTYTDGLAQGLGIAEVKPKNSKAISEFNQLVSQLYRSAI